MSFARLVATVVMYGLLFSIYLVFSTGVLALLTRGGKSSLLMDGVGYIRVRLSGRVMTEPWASMIVLLYVALMPITAPVEFANLIIRWVLRLW